MSETLLLRLHVMCDQTVWIRGWAPEDVCGDWPHPLRKRNVWVHCVGEVPWFDHGAASLEVGEGKGATRAQLHPAHPAVESSSFVQDTPDSPYGGCIIFLSAISCTEKCEPRATAPTSPGVVLAGAQATDVLAPPHHRPLPDGRAPCSGGCWAMHPLSLGMHCEQFLIFFLH